MQYSGDAKELGEHMKQLTHQQTQKQREHKEKEAKQNATRHARVQKLEEQMKESTAIIVLQRENQEMQATH